MTKYKYRSKHVVDGETFDVPSNASDLAIRPHDNGSATVCWVEKSGKYVL